MTYIIEYFLIPFLISFIMSSIIIAVYKIRNRKKQRLDHTISSTLLLLIPDGTRKDLAKVMAMVCLGAHFDIYSREIRKIISEMPYLESDKKIILSNFDEKTRIINMKDKKKFGEENVTV